MLTVRRIRESTEFSQSFSKIYKNLNVKFYRFKEILHEVVGTTSWNWNS